MSSNTYLTSLAATFDELLDRIGWGYEIDVEYKGRTYLLSDCAYLGGWQVICDYDDEDPQAYRDRDEFAERATIYGEPLREIWKKLIWI